MLPLTKLHRPTASAFMETGRQATATNESDVTTTDKDKTLQFDDDTLRGEKKKIPLNFLFDNGEFV